MGHREPGHRAAEDPAVHGAPALGGRDLLQVRNSVQEADAAVDQHALEAEAEPVQARCEAWQDGRHLRAAQRGPRLMEGQYERVSQSRELLYSVPAALCEEIARAATEELAERLSIQKRCHETPKMVKRDTGPFFCRFCSTSKAVPLNAKNGEEGHPPPFFSFFGRIQKRCQPKMVKSDTRKRPCRRASPAGRPPNG